MKKNITLAAVLTAAALVVAAVGTLLCAGLLGRIDNPGTGGWDNSLMLPTNVASAVALILAVTDAAAAALLGVLIASEIKTSKALKAEKTVNKRKMRFAKLHEADLNAKKSAAAVYDDIDGLKTLCEDFRNFAAFDSGLYYDLKTVRSYIAAMSITRLTVLQGISGTGKTSLAYTFGKFIGRNSVVAPVQPSWKDRSDMIGYYNEFTDTYTETDLLLSLYEANYSDDVFTVILDEMNISRVEYYFAEFLSLLELPASDSRRIRVTSDSRENDPELLKNGTLKLPENVWFAGTANNDDSTLAISDKVYDRAFVIEMDRRSLPFNAPETKKKRISAERLESLFAAARAGTKVSDETKNKLAALDEYLISVFQITFGNRIMRQTENFIPVYIACGGTETEALDIMIRGKIMRKLEALNPVYVRAHAEGLVEEINRLFGRGALVSTLEYINKYRNG